MLYSISIHITYLATTSDAAMTCTVSHQRNGQPSRKAMISSISLSLHCCSSARLMVLTGESGGAASSSSMVVSVLSTTVTCAPLSRSSLGSRLTGLRDNTCALVFYSLLLFTSIITSLHLPPTTLSIAASTESGLLVDLLPGITSLGPDPYACTCTAMGTSDCLHKRGQLLHTT